MSEADTPTGTSSTRSTFAPVVLLGLAGAGLAALAGSKEWVRPDLTGSTGQGTSNFGIEAGLGEMPLAGALALVVLACWGVILVARGRWRRWMTVLATLSGLGLLASVAFGIGDLRSSVPETLSRAGAQGEITTEVTWWFWAAGAGALVTLLAAVAAYRWAPTWPEMGRRYDAPANARARVVTTGEEPQNELDLWNSIGEGNDPTLEPPEER